MITVLCPRVCHVGLIHTNYSCPTAKTCLGLLRLEVNQDKAKGVVVGGNAPTRQRGLSNRPLYWVHLREIV